ncbi:hypothetical protein SteCoe_23202 [Stentor coeruleus]|uniref:Uncharacterized protein n=1 Tax=Stentor coeruleus TaxID=5963 RepID=A0A1R2BKE9_9CILI|nr:hypothetical protein SteCoe_23202 [Stentor coeruleus]
MSRSSKKIITLRDIKITPPYQIPSHNLDTFLTSKSTRNRPQEPCVNPFDNMKFNGKSQPSLRPIINKKKRYDFHETTEKNTTLGIKRIQNTNSLNGFPTLYKLNHEIQKPTQKSFLPPIDHKEFMRISPRNITTPHFNSFNPTTTRENKSQPVESKLFFRREAMKNIEEEENLRLKEISFGDFKG